jgi:hypothetical protein
MRPLLLVLALGLATATARAEKIYTVVPKLAPHQNLAGSTLVQTESGDRWWRQLAGDDGMGGATWEYYARQIRTGTAVPPPLAIVAPDHVVSRNFGLDLPAFAQAPAAPGMTSGGPPVPDALSGATMQDDCPPDAPTPDDAPDTAPPAPERREAPFAVWLRTVVGVDLVTFYVIVGCLTLVIFGVLFVAALLVLYLIFRR